METMDDLEEESQDDQLITFHSAPDSELMESNYMGRPRDTRFDGIVEEAFLEKIAKRCVVTPETQQDVVRGIKRGARHLDVSVSVLLFDPDPETGLVTIEFIAYPTHRRNKESE